MKQNVHSVEVECVAILSTFWKTGNYKMHKFNQMTPIKTGDYGICH